MSGEDELKQGEVLFGKYRVERVLGRGGMGVVVEATHLELEDRVAIKILRGDQLDDDGRARFLREARAAARLKSDHIMRVVDVGTLDSGMPYMVMELLIGADLASQLATHGKLAAPHAVDLVLQACFGLAEAHTQGFVHRDIKPTNLFVTETPDGAKVVKILDFGISKLRDDVTLTSSRAVLGTPAYMAPEQWRSAKDADARSDLWSVGAVLYELVEGVRPFAAETVTEMCAQVMADDPRPLEIATGELGKVIARCLEKEPEARFQSIEELAHALIPLSADPAEAEELVGRIERLVARRAEGKTPVPAKPSPVEHTGPDTVPEPRARGASKPPDDVRSAKTRSTDPPPNKVTGTNPWFAGGHVPGDAVPAEAAGEKSGGNPWFSGKKREADPPPAREIKDTGNPWFAAKPKRKAAVGGTDATAVSPAGEIGLVAATPVKVNAPAPPEALPAANRHAHPTSRSRTYRYLALGGVLVVGAIVFWIIHSRGATTPDPRPTAPSGSESAPPTGATGPVRGGTLRIATFRGDESSYALYSNAPTRSQHALHLAVERLLVLTPNGDRAPSVLSEVTTRNDGKELVLTLRDGVMFHPGPCGGRVATGNDVRYSVEVARKKNQLDLPIERYEVAGKDVILVLSRAAPLFSYSLTRVRLIPDDFERCESDLQKMRHPIGTGAFQIVDAPNPDTVALDASKTYWQKDANNERLPYLDRVELVPAKDASAVLAAMHQPPRAADAIHMFAPDEKARTALISTEGKPHLVGDARDLKDLMLGTRTNTGHHGLWLLEATKKDGPLHDPNVRKAIALAIDRAAAIAPAAKSTAAFSPVSPIGRFLATGVLGFDPSIKEYATDLDAAKRALAASKYPKPEIVLAYSHSQAGVDVVIAALASIGIKATASEIKTEVQVRMADEKPFYDGLFVSRWIELHGGELIEIGEFDRYRYGETTPLLEKLGAKYRGDREPIYTAVEKQLLDTLPTIPIGRLDPSRVTYATIVTRDVFGFQDRQTGYLAPESALSYTDVWLADRP